MKPPRITFREELALGHVVETALVPLAQRTTTVSAARVRAAVRWQAPAAPHRPLSRFGLLTRAGESVAAAMVAAMLFAGALGGPLPDVVKTPSVLEAYFRSRPPADEISFLRYLRLVSRDVAPDASVGVGTVLLDR